MAKKFVNYKLLIAAVASLALVGTTAAVAQADPVSAPSYTGEELFEGLMMNRGVLADETPELLLDESLAGSLSDDGIDSILAAVENQNPGIFEDFEAKVESGDPYLVREALYEGRDALYALSEDTGMVTPQSDTICGGTYCGQTFVVIVFFIGVVVVLRAMPEDTFSDSAETASQTLMMDEWVARIVGTLS